MDLRSKEKNFSLTRRKFFHTHTRTHTHTDTHIAKDIVLNDDTSDEINYK